MEPPGRSQHLNHLLAKGRQAWLAVQQAVGRILPLSLREKLGSALDSVWTWLAASSHVGPLSIIFICGVVLLAQALGYHESYLPWLPSSGLEVPPGWRLPPLSSLFYHYVSPYLKLIAILGGVMFHLALLRSTTEIRRLIAPLWIVSAFLATWVVMADYYDYKETADTVLVGQPFSTWAFVGKGAALVLLILSPALSLTYYQTRKIWEKYLLRSMAQPLALCILSIACIVIVFDVQDNLKDFQKQKIPPVQIFAFYVNLFPHIFVEAASPGMVLAAIFALLRFVRFNEMVSLMNAGLSLMVIARPVLMLSAFVCSLAMAANYHWAPRAEGQRQAIVKGLKRSSSSAIMHSAVMHYNENDRRLWFIGTVPYNLREDRMKRIQIHELDEHGQPKRGIFAASALWWPQGLWSFYRGYEVLYENGTPKTSMAFETNASGLQRLDAWWKETPWDIMVSTLNPNNMGVPELAAYLDTPGMVKEETLRRHYTAELWHRLTFPWQGFMLVVLTLGLLCQSSRKGNLNGTGLVLAAFVINHFLLNNVSISLARSAQMPPRVAAWLPHVAVGLPAIILLWWRAYGTKPPFGRLGDLSWFGWRNCWRIIRGRRTRPWRGRRFRASWLNGGTDSV